MPARSCGARSKSRTRDYLLLTVMLVVRTSETAAAWCANRVLHKQRWCIGTTTTTVSRNVWLAADSLWHARLVGRNRALGHLAYCPQSNACVQPSHGRSGMAPQPIAATPLRRTRTIFMRDGSAQHLLRSVRLSSSIRHENNNNNNNNNNNGNCNSDDTAAILEWSILLREAYERAETDGIQQLLRSMDPDAILSARQLWEAVTLASHRATGLAASMLNAILAFTCDLHNNDHDHHDAPTISSSTTCSSSKPQCDVKVKLDALELFETATAVSKSATNNHQKVFTVEPDVVTYSLLYTSLMLQLKCSNHQFPVRNQSSAAAAAAILAQAVHASHKAAGSARRKARTAASRRQKQSTTPMTCFRDAEASVRDWLGHDDFCVLYEDSNVLVVNKPAGVCSYHTRTTAAGQIASGNHKKRRNDNSDVSLHDALVATGLPLSTLNPVAQGLVHRLDRGTSGCQCWAKNDATHARLVSDFVRRQNRKTYQCIVLVPPQQQQPQQCDSKPSPVSSSPTLSSFLLTDEDAGTIELPVHGRSAVSHYRVLQRYSNNNHTVTAALLLQVETRTGRKHQVRIHCAQGLGCPILGDTVYGRRQASAQGSHPAKKGGGKQKKSEPPEQQQQQQRFHLHAATLQLPLLGNDIVIEAPLPSWWTPQIEELQQQ